MTTKTKGIMTDEADDFELSEEQQNKVKRKVTLILMPWLSLLYLLAFLDRANLSNAKYLIVHKTHNITNNITEDNFNNNTYVTGFISESEYGVAAAFFYVGYTVFEIPSNLALKKTSAPAWISRIMVSWGIVTICTIFVKNAMGLFICRIVLGVAEAGFFPGVLYYLSHWFTPAELATRIAIFYMTNPLSLFLGGIISYGILQMDGLMQLAGWQWLFLLEGIPSVLCGILTFFIIPDKPSNCKFLTEPEKKWLQNHINSNNNKSNDSHNKNINCKDVLAVFKSVKVWLFAVMNLFALAIGGFVNFFLQAVLGEMGFDGLTSNLLSAPFYFFGVVCLIGISYNSDRTQERGLHVIIPLILQIISWAGVALCFFFKAPVYVLYVNLLLSVGFYFTFSPVFWAWASREFNKDTSTAVNTAFINSLGASAQIWAPIITSTIFVETGSYGIATVVLCGFGIINLVASTTAAILHKRKSEYTALEEDEEEELNGKRS